MTKNWEKAKKNELKKIFSLRFNSMNSFVNSLMIFLKIQKIEMSDIFRKFVNILNESVDKFNWICGLIKMNSLMNFHEFIDEFK